MGQEPQEPQLGLESSAEQEELESALRLKESRWESR
jgi:hypothetical protein